MKFFSKNFIKKASLMIITLISALGISNVSLAGDSKWPFSADEFDWGNKDVNYYVKKLNIYEQNIYNIIGGLRLALVNKKLRTTDPKFKISVGNEISGRFTGIVIRVCEIEESVSYDRSNCLFVKFQRK